MNKHLGLDRDAVTERRAMVMELVNRGLPEWMVASRTRLSHRTVQRYKRMERQGIPARANRIRP